MFLRVCVLFFCLISLLGCGGSGGGGNGVPDPDDFVGTWVGTWDLSASEVGTATVVITNQQGGGVAFDGDVHSVPLNTDGNISGAFDDQGIVTGGVYQLAGNPSFAFIGGSASLSQDGTRLTGALIIEGGGSLDLDLTKQ